ncbi:DUF3907 family protein [Alteribacter populi]|uniref:DUF3907 family protein n=1 Tax=Alteribacter populi TaxID=2011011 RepID=UPI000BBB50E1|nr:DUF3907 family protein [Alteribacter populi]
MGNNLVKHQLSFTEESLSRAANEIRVFLNGVTLDSLAYDRDQSLNVEHIEPLLDELRRLLVYCDEGGESCKIILSGETFRKAAAEKTLYWIFHQCIEEFFQPRLDAWYEDSRAAYTGKNAIKFRNRVPKAIETLMANLEGPMQQMREELEYYETDYHTKVIHSERK